MQILKDASLRSFNTFGIDVKAKNIIILSSRGDISEFLSSDYAKTDYYILGGGANVLFTDNYPGTIVIVNNKGIEEINCTAENIYLKVAAGEVWDDFVRYCVGNFYYGIENLALIPGKVGSSSVQNMGAYGREARDNIFEVHAIDRKTLEKRIFKNADCRFEYRGSIFKKELKNCYFITDVVFELGMKKKFYTGYADVSESLKCRENLSLKSVYEHICEIRRQKLPDIEKLGSAGSFFKNPLVNFEKYSELKSKYPELKAFAVEKEMMKLSAAQLIDILGWKGKRIGNVGVYPRHALVLVNYGGGKGKEIKSLADAISRDVYANFGVNLEAEVIYL